MASTWPDNRSIPIWWADIQRSLDEAFDQYASCLETVEIHLNSRKGNNRDILLALLNKELHYTLKRLKSALYLAECRKADALSSGIQVPTEDCRKKITKALYLSAKLQKNLKTSMENLADELSRLHIPRNSTAVYKDTTPLCIDLHL